MAKCGRLVSASRVLSIWLLAVCSPAFASGKQLPQYLAAAGSAEPGRATDGNSIDSAREDAVAVAPGPIDAPVLPSGLAPAGTPVAERLSRTVKPGEAFQPLTLRQKARLQLLTTFQPETLLRVTVTAGLATLRDSPQEWPRTVEAYQWRFADRIGQRLVFKQVQYTVGSMMLGEDPRYFMAEDRGKWSRVKNAFKQTWMVRRDNGNWAPAYGTFAGAYAASVVSSRWQPERRQEWDSVVIRGSSQIGFQFCNNLVREFLPDIKKAFRR